MTLRGVASGGVCQTKRKLCSTDDPVGVGRFEGEEHAGDVVDLSAVWETDFDGVRMKMNDTHSCVLHQAVFYREMALEGTYRSDLQVKAVWRHTWVAEVVEVVGNMFVQEGKRERRRFHQCV